MNQFKLNYILLNLLIPVVLFALFFFTGCMNYKKNENVVISGEYYDWTKTMQPEIPWNYDYNKTLVTKMFLCSRDSIGNVDQVYLKFEDALEVIRKIDNITLGIPKITYLVGWQYNGHDSKYPSWGEVNNHLKRDQDSTALESLHWLMKEAKAYNTIVSFHINMIDAFKDSPLWDEYMTKDIVAKDTLGNLIKGEVFAGMQSYQLSYAREWELGLAQKRIDELIEMIPEIRNAGTIHIDAFHSMRASGPGEPISPYLGNSIEDEICAQRKIFRYWQSKGIDVTSEGAKYWLRKDPFIGLQAMTWHFNEENFVREDWPNKPKDFIALPAIFSAYTPMHCEGEIMKDHENLTGLIEQSCVNLIPWYYKRNSDASQRGDVILTQDLIICPILWKEKSLAVYSKVKDLPNTEITVPSTWGNVKKVQIFELTIEGLKPFAETKITNGSVLFSVTKGIPLVLIPFTENSTN